MRAVLKSKAFWVAALLAGGAFWWWQSGSSGDANKKPPVIVRVAPAEQKDVPLALKNVGTVVTSDSVAVKSRLDSQVMEVKFKDGDYVQQGDVLFLLDDRTLKAQLGEMQANLERDKAQLANLQAQYERSKQLALKEFTSKADLDNARAAYEAQHGTMGASEAAMQNIKVQLEYTRITAPISGRTGTINITVGNTVKANDTQALVVINQVKPILVQVSLPQRYLDAVRSAMVNGSVTVIATREGGAEASSGTLEYIDNTVDQSTGTFAARAIFPNDDEALWPGMFVNLTLTLGEEKNVTTVPEVAIQHGQSGDFVFVIAEDKAEKRAIKVARLQDSVAVIESGLKPGEQVAVDGLMSLTDTSAVTVKSDTPVKP
jgi:membrane fusion protein, multidrug efflux system